MNSQKQGRPLSDLREEFWMIKKLGCGGFGSVIQLNIFFANHIKDFSSLQKVYLIRNRATKEYCAAKHQKWTSISEQKLIRREMSILRNLSNKEVKLLKCIYPASS